MKGLKFLRKTDTGLFFTRLPKIKGTSVRPMGIDNFAENTHNLDILKCL